MSPMSLLTMSPKLLREAASRPNDSPHGETAERAVVSRALVVLVVCVGLTVAYSLR